MKMEIKNNTTHILGPHDAKPKNSNIFNVFFVFFFDKTFYFLKNSFYDIIIVVELGGLQHDFLLP